MTELTNNSARKKKIFILSNGCHESYMDTAMLEQYFDSKEKYVLVTDLAEANLIILLGCSVMQGKEDETREIIKMIEEHKSPGAKQVIAGCISKVYPELISSDEDSLSLTQKIDDLLNPKYTDNHVNPHFPYKLYRKDGDDLMAVAKQHRRNKSLRLSITDTRGFIGTATVKLSGIATKLLSKYNNFIQQRIDVWDKGTYTIKISTGCYGNCSYCSIKQSRGTVRSRKIEKVVEDFKEGLSQGYTSFALIGTDIGDFGKDNKENLLDLLRRLVKLDGSFKIRLRNLNPRWLISSAPQLCELLVGGKISYIQSPIQSGSNNVLKLMNRGYKAEDYLAVIKKIREACPNIFIKTQIIVGFPSETAQDFLQDALLYKSKLFNYIDVFGYTDRPNTQAMTLPNHLPPTVVSERNKKLLCKSLFSLAPKQLVKNWLSSQNHLGRVSNRMQYS